MTSQGSRAKTLIPLCMGLVLTACSLGIGTAVLLDRFDPKWGIYVCLCMLGSALILATGHLRHALLFLAAFTLPLGVDFRLFARARDLTGSDGVFLSFPDVSTLLLLAILILAMLARSGLRVRLCSRTTTPWLLLLAAVILSVPLSFDKTVSVYRGILVVQHAFLYFVFANLVRTEDDVGWVLKYLVLGLTLGGSLYLISCFTGKDFNLVTGAARELETFDQYGGVFRPSGTFGHPIQAGQYFIAAAWIPLALLGSSRNVLGRLLLYGVFALASVCIAYTLSRAAYLGYICQLLFYLVYGVWSGSTKISTAVISAVIVSFLLVLVGGLVWNRLTLDDQGSGESRKPLNKQAIYMAVKNPAVGVGAGTYAMAMDQFRPPGLKIPWRHYVHNEYLMWWAECGTPGLLALLLLMTAAFREAWATAKNKQTVIKATGLAALCMLVGSLPNMWYDIGFIALALPAARLFTILLGVTAAAAAIAREKQAQLETTPLSDVSELPQL